jgi:hypothetical protein
MSEHPLPGSLAEWLPLWQPARTGNFYLRIGADMYVVYRDHERGCWRASVGRHFLGMQWHDPDAAKVGLFHTVRGVSAATLAAWHAGTPAPEPGPPAPADPPPLVLVRIDRGDGSVLTLERRAFRGRGFLALVNRGRADRFATLRLSEARRVGLALLRAAPETDPPPPRPVDLDRWEEPR